jgi:hypothetical protein
MATVTVTHSVVQGGTVDATADVDGAAWDANHVVGGLENVDNTADADKPVSTATQTALDLKANLASPSLTGTPTAPTAAPATNTTQVATTAFVLANSATPGGSTTQVQYNNAGALGGISGATTDGATLTLVAPVLGTPASVTLTNADGTAASLTAGTATNAVNSGITDDTTTNATMYPVWVTANTGNLPLKVSSTKIVFNPSNGRLGIGNTAPLSLLHLGGGSDASTLGTVPFYINVDAGDATFAVRDSTNDIELGMFTNTFGGGLAALGTRTNHPFWIQTASANTAAFHTNGGFSVGGTTAPNTNSIGAIGGITANYATSIPAGGTAGAGLKVSSTANFGVFFGSGAPTLTAAKGSLYLRSDGSSTSTRMYVNTDGGTTWTSVTTVA